MYDALNKIINRRETQSIDYANRLNKGQTTIINNIQQRNSSSDLVIRMMRSPLMQRRVNNSDISSAVMHNNEHSTRLASSDIDDHNVPEQYFAQYNSSQQMDTPIKQLNTLSNRNLDKQNMQSDIIPSILRAAADKRNQLTIDVPIQNDNNNKQNISPQRRKNAVDGEKGISKIEVEQQQKPNQKHIKTHHDKYENSNNDDMLLFGHGLQTISQRQQQERSPHLSQQNLSNKTLQPHKQSPPSASTQLLQPPSLSLKDINEKAQAEQNKNNKIVNKLSYSISQPCNRFQTYLNTTRTPSMILKFFNPSSLTKSKLLFSHNQSPCLQSDIFPRSQLKASRESIITKKQLKLTLANNLDKILFKYSGGHTRVLYNNKLKIKNDSPVRVEVKILCTSPSHYDVKPLSDIVMCPSQIMNFVIEMKLYLHDLDHVTMKHDLQRYRGDMFKISYWPSQYSPDIEYEEGERVLPVVIEDTEEEKIRNEGLLKNQKDDQMKIVQNERSIDMYKKMIAKNDSIMVKMEQQVKQVVNKRFYAEYFTKSLFWTVAVIGLMIGWWLG